MDLAESILNELITLQKKNEELLAIISRLEHESDVIIRQFEEKISDLNKNLKKAQELSAKSEKKYEMIFREKNRDLENYSKEKHDLEESYHTKISDLESLLHQQTAIIAEKNEEFRNLLELKEKQEQSFLDLSAEMHAHLTALTDQMQSEQKSAEIKINTLRLDYDTALLETKDILSRKEKELRTLADNLKKRIDTDKKAKIEWDRERSKYQRTIKELQTSLDTQLLNNRALQTQYEEEKDKKSQIIDSLNITISELQTENDNLTNESKRKVAEFEKEIVQIRSESDLHISILEKEKASLYEEIQDQKTINEDLTKENSELFALSEQLNSDVIQKDSRIALISDQIIQLQSEKDSVISDLQNIIAQKDEYITEKSVRISDLESELLVRENQYRDLEISHDVASKDYQEQVSNLKTNLQTKENFYQKEVSVLSSQVEDTEQLLEETIRQRDQREQEFRDEISYLHEELIRRNEEWKEKLESGARDLAERDRHISLISGNNEALRAELERVRSRLIMLEKTIREDNEEPVHALYRQIQNLSAKLAGKESENSVLASRIIRLDTENTRLVQLLAEGDMKEVSYGDAEKSNPRQIHDKPLIPTNSEFAGYLSNLDDPLHAMEAAASILQYGSQVTDMLIPLLYRGTLNRRAWIAVLLYELNDPRATKPLSDLLEASESGLRELIWDTRLRFREWRRSGTVSSMV
ncbi:hypothetical protein KHC33_08190 [Methanospirillum sp. J.3.6.1-F.2.7.3]|uniref:Uncharacterized protein n=1 Tax=Methanospirillum purgamenti TaxID=2834276 RepID=A0A8E7B111_9EURY|nr:MULTISPECIES: hypothetical protein [Methanospirillum]MDX8550165.1 hypothetical protein [Methanospirillum hungatei]QVV90445.1 hypothetical protein KHC33_08190 [Methanospirillum sp. J.3.6.1-F.2.7.3]